MKRVLVALATIFCASITAAQPPPPRAYTDGLGKRSGDTVLHATPQGMVQATCVASPAGLVARPNLPLPAVATATRMIAPTRTATALTLRTATRTPTLRATRTPTRTVTSTRTRPRTVTPIRTSTRTFTQTFTPTRTLPPTWTRTPTRTATSSPTRTLTATRMPSATPTRTAMPSPTVGDGPTACSTQADWAAPVACPADALSGCACSTTPQGRVCVPQCTTVADCPKPPDKTLICGQDGLCIEHGAATPGPTPGGGGELNTTNTVSDLAQSMTIAFDELAFVTGNFCAQTFYPPGKVADFFGFQYLRDNDPSALCHNTEFTTLAADPILAMLSDAQIRIFVALPEEESPLSAAYGYARFSLAQAFGRLLDGDGPDGATALSRDAVKGYSAELFAIDGEMSFLPARAYADVLGSMSPREKAVLDAMKGLGAAEWPQPSTEPAALHTYRDYGVELRTYAGEMFAWYAGSIDADVYFCPERQGADFGFFFMKDIKAMHNPDYTIDSNMTADMGDAFRATLTSEQAALVTGLVSQQKSDLLAIVVKREQIATTLRNLLATGGAVDEATVVGLARQYGELDGEVSYY